LTVSPGEKELGSDLIKVFALVTGLPTLQRFTKNHEHPPHGHQPPDSPPCSPVWKRVLLVLTMNVTKGVNGVDAADGCCRACVQACWPLVVWCGVPTWCPSSPWLLGVVAPGVSHASRQSLLCLRPPLSVGGQGCGGPAPGARSTLAGAAKVTLGFPIRGCWGVSLVVVTPLQLTVMTVSEGDVAAARARVQALRRSLGAQLAMYRTGAGVIQPHLGRIIGKSRSMVSRIEHGTRTMPEALWTIADEVCAAQGALIAQYHRLAEAQQDYRAQCRAHRAQVQHSQAQAQALQATPAVPGGGGLEVWLEMTGVDQALARELVQVVKKLVQSAGRRKAIRLLGSLLALIGSSGLDADEYTRLSQALEAPHRVDTHVVHNLAIMLAQCKRLEDKLGPCEVLDTVIAQHELVHHLLEGGCPERLRKPLSLVDSNIEAYSAILIDD
jgi:DNA-binding XRE family transcriptional regulator